MRARTQAPSRHRPARRSVGTQPRQNSRPKATEAVKTVEALHFRPRTDEDDSYIMDLTERELGRIHREAFGDPFPREPFLRYLQSGAPTVILEQGGHRIGYYSYLIGPDLKMHVTALVLDSVHQAQGLGRKVMNYLEEQAYTQGVRVMEVFVQDNNTKSLAFTKELGFTEAYRIPPNSICFRKTVAAQQGKTGGLAASVPATPESLPHPREGAPFVVPWNPEGPLV
ncbi:GNAT family N-acetyltransferase [Alicyclobacillaceae bacterium I2511]|nr:GNAT family N-acetyltransferase [Alicyclobacillaceae bacterium I2511]